MNSTLWKASLILIPILWNASDAVAQTSYDLHSPDHRILIRVRMTDRVRYDVLLKDRPLLQDATLSIDIDHQTLGLNPKVKTKKERSVDDVLVPVVRQKFARIRENYNELRLEMEGGYAVVFRAYNEVPLIGSKLPCPRIQCTSTTRRPASISPAITRCSTRRRKVSSLTTSGITFRFR